jgi:hypothetical protein
MKRASPQRETRGNNKPKEPLTLTHLHYFISVLLEFYAVQILPRELEGDKEREDTHDVH